VLVDHAWDQEVKWSHIDAWTKNFVGLALSAQDEQVYALLALTRFMYFGKRLVREMLKSLYRDHFKTVVMQRIRRNYGGTTDCAILQRLYGEELDATRFLGVGNPSESGAHLLYYFRQVNYLSKRLFVDVAAAFQPEVDRNSASPGYIYVPREAGVTRYVFFDDMVGSGDQAVRYLSPYLRDLRRSNRNGDLRYLCLFATTEGLRRLNQPSMFDGNATCLFELDETYKCLREGSRHFLGAPDWFDVNRLKNVVLAYAPRMPGYDPLGYRGCELMLGFAHNTPDNTLPIFWYGGKGAAWDPVFLRYDKKYV
jgi:hypothetical protein